MASARRTGTNESVKTYGAGQDYTSLATWESDTDNNNVSGTVSPVLACLAAQYDDSVTMNTAVNDASYFRIIRPQAGQFHTGIRDTGVRFYSTALSVAVFTLSDNNDQLQDLCIRATYSSAQNRATVIAGGSSSGIGIIGCIITNSQNSGSGAVRGIDTGASPTVVMYVVASVIENCEGVGITAAADASHTLVIYNTTVVGGTTGLSLSATATVTAKNCLAHGTATADWSGAIDAGSNNASEDTTALGTSPRTSQTFTFVNAAGFDYHLSGSDGGAKDFGTDLSADSAYAFNDDLDRNPFGTWDIGADEPTVSSASVVPILMRQYRARWAA